MKLIIAEKRSTAAEIANVLSDYQINHHGYIEVADNYITWCAGHFVGLSKPESYDAALKKWTLSSLPFIPQQWQFDVSPNGTNQFTVIQNLINDSCVDEIICATDSGREGECIFRYIYLMTGCQKPFKRLWLSSMSSKGIKRGMSNLLPGDKNDNLFEAGFARAKADYLFGYNFTRLFTLKNNGILCDIGRVQTSLLNMIVSRDKLVDEYCEKKYYTVDLHLKTSRDNIHCVSDVKYDSYEAANEAAALCCDKAAKCIEAHEKRINIEPPKLYNLSELQKDANLIFGYTAKQTADYAQSLFEAKLITHPHSESRYLSEDMIDIFSDNIIYAAELLNLGEDYIYNILNCIDNSQTSEHSAIIFTSEVFKYDKETLMKRLPEGERNIFFLIAKRIIIASEMTCQNSLKSLSFDCNGSFFNASSKKTTVEGWLSDCKRLSCPVESEQQQTNDFIYDYIIQPGSEFEVCKAYAAEHVIQAQKRFTDASIIESLTNAQVGTPSTRCSILENLIRRGYVNRFENELVSTEKGKALIGMLPEEIKSVKLTQDWEEKLRKIEFGELSSDIFMHEVISFVTKYVNRYKRKQGAKVQKEVLGLCPKCGGNIYEGANAFYCANSIGKKGYCTFFIKKDEKFFLWKKKNVSPELVKAILKTGKIRMHNLYSERRNSYYDGIVTMDASKEFVSFSVKMIEPNK